MTLQNRVLPDGSIVALAVRGDMMGNRGILHRPDRTLGQARWRHSHWIICALAFKGRHREVMTGRSWTELFFLDEAVALAAGHRPCAECRREAYGRFRSAWQAATGTMPSAAKMDHALHQARIAPGTRLQATFRADATLLPDGCFFRWQDAFWLARGPEALRFSPAGYDFRTARPAEVVDVLTPLPTVRVLAQGYSPLLHGSAR